MINRRQTEPKPQTHRAIRGLRAGNTRFVSVGWARLSYGLLSGAVLSCTPPPDDAPAARSQSSQDLPGRIKNADNGSEEPIVHVPVGEFTSGSVPGLPGRDPATEPTETRVKLGPFRIDREVFATEPAGGKRRFVIDQKEAEALCAGRSGRLCTELEWERACKGPASSPFPGGIGECKDPSGCASGFDVLGMGAQPEWTGSFFGKGSERAGQPVVRGAPQAAPDNERHCGRRLSVQDLRQSQAGEAPTPSGIAFRCCYGAPNAARVTEPVDGKLFEETNVSLDELKTLLDIDAHTRDLKAGLSFFKEDAAATVLARGPGETMGFTLTTRPVKWSPARGVEFLVVTARSGENTTFVVAYHLGASPPKLAGSFIMKNERGPIALAYASSIRPRMHFSGCWGCPGETGKLLFRPKEELVLLQP